MKPDRRRTTRAGVVRRQVLIGQVFGVAGALALYAVEVAWLARDVHDRLGASLATVLAVYVAFGWVLGSFTGLLWGAAGAGLPRIRRRDGTVPALGPVLGFLFFAVFVTRWDTARSLMSPSPAVVTSLAASILLWVGLGYLGRRVVFRWIPSQRRDISPTLLSIVALFTLLGSAAVSAMEAGRLPRRTPASPDSPNVVLVVADGVRPDHLSVYGYVRDTSPNLERFAGTATVFWNAYSHATRALPATASMFTSLYPSLHGANVWDDGASPLPAVRPTLAEICRDAGYTTVGLMSNVFLRPPFGLERGFDYIENFESRRSRLSVYRILGALRIADVAEYAWPFPVGGDVTDAAIGWLRRLGDGPFLLFVSYMDAHHPLFPEAHHQRVFVDPEDNVDPAMLFSRTVAMAGTGSADRISEQDLHTLVDLYDACVRQVDHEFGRLLWQLELLEPARETVVVFTSAYGTEFLENGSLYHRNRPVEALIHVPLVIGRVPARETGNRVNGLVRHVDLLPTVAEMAGGRRPGYVNGSGLVPLLDGAFAPTAEFTIARSMGDISLNRGAWKMECAAGADSCRLYDLTGDPWGRTDVSGDYPRRAAEMRAILDDHRAGTADLAPADTRPLTEEVRKQIELLDHL